MDNGLLHIDMQREEPESKAQKIKITNTATNGKLKAIGVDKKTSNEGDE